MQTNTEDPMQQDNPYYNKVDPAIEARVRELLGRMTLAEKVGQYRRLLHRDFASDLEFGSRLAKRIFHGSFLFGSVPARMVQFTRRSPRFSAVIQDLFAGRQSYPELKRRLLKNLNGSLYEIAMGLGFSCLVPRKAG